MRVVVQGRGSSMRLGLLMLMLTWASVAFAGDATPQSASNCPTHASLEGYTIRDARVEHPFAFLRWLKPVTDDADNAIAFLKGQNYRVSLVSDGIAALEKKAFLPETGDPAVRVNILIATVENCDGNQLDVVYRVFSTQVLRTISPTLESKRAEREAPQQKAGLTTESRLVLQPRFGYNRSDGFGAGGHLESHLRNSAHRPFEALILEGLGSASSYSVSAALAGKHDAEKAWLRHAEWQVNYANSDAATDQQNLRNGRLAAQFAAASRPAGSAEWALRFGGLIEGGNLQSGFSASQLAANTLPSSGYGAMKFYVGTSARSPHQTFAASYGLELGSAGGAQVDWRKHIGDVAHEFWYPLGNHRLLELESRFTAGAIQIPGSIPVAARFFGGNTEQNFISGDNWIIRANPLIRSIPSNRFNRTSAGAGAGSFASYNFTGAYTVWRKPIVPNEILNDADFKKQKDDGLTAATSILDASFRSADMHFKNAAGKLPEVRDSITRMQAAEKAAEASHQGQLTAEFKHCNSALQRAGDRAKSATEAKSEEDRYGNVAALLNDDETEDRLHRANQACVVDLNGTLQDAALDVEGAKLDALRVAMQTEFDQIDQASASARAAAEILPARTTLDTILNDVNLLSVSPVGVFDVARIGPAKDAIGGVRYGLGGGVRFTLVSAVSFTAGYAWNINRHPGEGQGAVFVSLKFRDLFQ